MLHEPFYDPNKTYEENFTYGPFGAMRDGVVFENKGKPQHVFLGKPVYSLFGIAAGPLPTERFARSAWEKGFDIITFKSVRTGEYPCHPMPNILPIQNKNIGVKEMKEGVVIDTEYREPLTVTNSFGIPSYPREVWEREIKKTLAARKDGQLLIVPFQGTDRKEGFNEYVKDHVKGIQALCDIGVEILEINLSCPNEGNHKLMCFDVEGTEKILTEVNKVRGSIPLLVKIAYFEDKELLAAFVKRIGPLVDGVVAINTLGIPVKKSDGTPAFPGAGREKAGVSGAPIKWAGLEMVGALVRLRKENGLSFAIVGVGGVTNKKDFEEYHAAGADAVFSVAGALWNPYLAQEIKEKLR